jgi:hypothetical protein
VTKEDCLKILDVVQAGSLMSNLVWNIAVNAKPGDPITESMKRTAIDVLANWDKANLKANRSLTAMKQLPAAFDPITMGA